MLRDVKRNSDARRLPASLECTRGNPSMSRARAASNRRKPVFASSALGLAAALPAGAALAQPAATPLTGVEVTGSGPPDYKVDTVSISKLTQPMVDTPQQIESISRQLMQDRGAANLNDVL